MPEEKQEREPLTVVETEFYFNKVRGLISDRCMDYTMRILDSYGTSGPAKQREIWKQRRGALEAILHEMDELYLPDSFREGGQ